MSQTRVNNYPKNYPRTTNSPKIVTSKDQITNCDFYLEIFEFFRCILQVIIIDTVK